MKYEENFQITKNPFIFKGVTGRLAYFLTSLSYSLIMSGLVWVLCPKSISALANPMIIQNKAPLGILLANAPVHEIVLFIGITLLFLCLSFIINKKRLLDIIGEKENALKTALIYSAVIFIMGIQTNFFAPSNSPQLVILSVGFLIINLFLFLKKGQITGKKN